MLQLLMPRRSPGSLTAPHASLNQNWTPTRTRSVVDGGLPSGCKPRLFTSGGQNSVLNELATALEQATSLPAEVIARLARARDEERVAEGAERARAADLGHASAAQSARERTQDLTAARRDTQVADTAGAHASSDRTAAQLAAESFPHTAADGVRAAITGRLQQPERSPARTAAVTDTRRPGLAP